MAKSALCHQPFAQTRRSLHARNGVAHLRHAAGQVPAGLRAVRVMLRARQSADQPVRARLDAAFRRRAEHSHDGDGAAASGQHRRCGRRHERAARALQYPGSDRHRPPVERNARLSHFGQGYRDDVRRLYEDAALQAGAARAGELLAELQEVLRQLPEGDLRQGRDRRQRLGLRLAAETRHPAL